jgi:intein/homing endonuclease
MSWEAGHQKLHNKFRGINEEILNTKGFIDERKSKLLLYKFLKENPSFTSEFMTGVSLFPFQHMAIKAMMDSDYFLGIWSRGMSKCSHYDSLVWTDRGLIKIGDIKIGDKVQSLIGFNEVENKVINNKQQSYKITTQSGLVSNGLDYHKLLVFNKDLEFEWKFSKDIIIDDILVIKKFKTLELLQKDIFADFKFENNVVNFNKPKVVKFDNAPLKDWYYFFGLLIGDGCILNRGISITSEDFEIKDFLEAFSLKLGLNLTVANKPGKTKDFRIYSKELISFLYHLGFDQKKACEKNIPSILTQASSENIQFLMRGLFDTDGYCATQRKEKKGTCVRVGFTSTSEVLIHQILNLCLQEGFLFKKKLTFKGGVSNFPNGKIYNCNKAWSLILSDGKSVKEFGEKIGFNIKRKQSKILDLQEQTSQDGSFCEFIPYVGDFLKKKLNKKSICFIKDEKKIKLNFREKTSRVLLNKILNFENLPDDIREKLNFLNKNDVYFEKVKSVEMDECITVDIQVANEHCYIADGIVNHNSFSTAVFAILDATLNQGVHIGIISKSFRQSKMIFRKIEEISRSPKAGFLAQCITRISKTNDEWIIEIGRSRITALPLGDGEKLRGFRFQRMIIDELLLMPEKILNEVILPFLSVVENPTERQQLHDLESKLIAKGEMTEEDRYRWPSNKIIGLSSASYKFEYLYKLYQEYERLIMHPDRQDGAHRVIMHFSYDCAPQQLYDQNLLSQAKATMSQSQFEREFGSVFTDDSSGYFKVSKMALCTVVDGEGQSVEIMGESKAEYIASFDPSWSESDGSDDFAIQLIKLNPSKKGGTVVHSYAMAGTNLKKHIEYFHYLLSNFNIIAVVGDYNGGVQFLSACNESEVFKRDGLKLDTFDFDFDNIADYDKSLREARSQYNLTTKRIVHLRKPSSFWIRYANELLQGSFDHRRIWFAGMAIDDDYSRQKTAKISIDDIKYSKIEEDLSSGAKLIDFIEHQKDMIELIKVQCALVQVTTSTQGTQSFDLPSNLKKQKGANRARKDSYSALVLGNWMMHMYYDMMAVEAAAAPIGFTPMFIC